MQLSHIFGILMISMGIKSEKINLKFKKVFLLCHYAQMKLVGKLIGDEKIVISTIKIGLSYKSFFVLGMLHTSRDHNSMI